MKKRIFSRWLLTALAAMTVFSAPAAKKTFTVASLNVDGLPPTVKAGGVYNVNLNPEGPQETGTTQISKLVSQKGWDFFAVSEAFNYNDELMSSLNGVYSTGTFRNKITDVGLGDVGAFLAGNKWFDTDGLNLLWSNASGITVSGEQWTLWNKRNGITSDGSDQLIAKGFRYYCVTVGTGMEVDVYIHHMDAETKAEDNAAREVQMNQLVDAILASDNKRPILIMGDTNCRYTRDRIVEIMFDRINADPRFTMHDPWIDYPRKGIFPNVGDAAIMVPRPFNGTEESHQGFQTGEVVDKIWWIENTDSPCKLTALNYLQDTDFTWPDGSEISDHYPIVIDFEIEKLRDDLTGGEFYLHNIGTDKWMAAGHNWGTRGIVDGTGAKIYLESVSGKDNTFIIRPSTLYENNGAQGYLGDNLYMDNSVAQEYEFTQVPGTAYMTITLSSTGKNVAAGSDDNLYWADPDSSDPAQQWAVIAPSTRLADLKALASESNPVNATFLIPGYNMGRNDKDADTWKTLSSNGGSVTAEIAGAEDAVDSNTVLRIYNNKTSGLNASNKSKWTLNRTISGLPNGKYTVGCQASSHNNNATISFNGKDGSITRGSDNGSYAAVDAGKDFNNPETYKTSVDLTVTDNQITISMAKSAANSSAGAVCVDNFFLTYYGPTAEDMAVFDRVKAAIDDAQAKADAAGLTDNYNNKAVVNAWESRLIQGNGDTEIHNTYIALAKAATKQREIPATMTYAILNNSFEMGSLVEWSNNATNAQVVKGSVNGSDGEYYLKADKGTVSYTFEVTMPNGLYEAKAMVSPGTVLEAGGLQSPAATGNAGELSEAVIRFMIKDGVATISATNAGELLADNFTLRRVGGFDAAEGFEMISLAIKDATERINRIGAPYNDGWTEKMKVYQDKLDNLDIEGNGLKEFNEIYDLLRAQVYQRVADGKSGDCTNAIINNSFEFGEIYGWDLLSTAGDTGVKENSNSIYTISPVDGNYVFNTWNEGRGTILSQTIPNLPAGHYQLSAYFASGDVSGDEKCFAYLEVKGQEGIASQKEITEISTDKTKSQTVTLEFEVAANTPSITICAGSTNTDGSWDDFGGRWYKADNFKLVRTGDEDRCFFYTRLRNAIKEANDEARQLPAKYRDQWPEMVNKYEQIIETHLSDGHDPEDENKPNAGDDTEDPLEGGSGIDEINALFADLRELIFSQTETGANMSGAIVNNSFELGDLTGWSCTADPEYDAKVVIGNEGGIYGTEPIDGKYLFNCWKGGDVGRPIYQVIPNVPSGKYTLSVRIAADAGSQFIIGANKKFSEIFTVPAAEDGVESKTVFHNVDFTFEVPVEAESKDVRIGLFPTVNDYPYDDIYTDDENGTPVTSYSVPWYKVDDFRLKLESRYLDIAWTPETEDCGTIMLPFALDQEEYNESLGQYGFKAYYIDQLEKNETPADIERNLYRIIKLSEPLDALEANKPYLLVKDAAETANVKKIKAAEGEDATSYNITGWSTNKEDLGEGEKGILLGSLTDYSFNYLHYHLQKDELGNIGFILHDPSNESHDAAHLEQYHACIKTALTPEGFAETDGLVMQSFYFDEPVQKWEVELEEGRYGTIVLPFDANVPDGLVAVEMVGVTDLRNSLDYTYQVAQWSEPVSKLEANVPYVVRSNDASKTLFTFEGVAQNEHEEFSPEGNLLTGLFKSRDGVYYNDEKKRDRLEAGHWVLTHDENDRPVFMKTTEETELPAYSAYISNPEVIAALDTKSARTHLLAEEGETAAASPAADVIYLNESHAENTFEWEMETIDYGTLILPIDADVPEDLEAYELTAPTEDVKNMPTLADNDKTYQLLTMTAATTLEANKTYLMVKKVADTEETAPLSVKAASQTVYEFSGAPNAQLSPAATGVLLGTYEGKAVSAGDYLLNEEGKGGFEKLASGAKVSSLHGYISQDGLSATPDYLLLVEPKGDTPDSVQEILAGEENVDIYTLQGVRVAHDVVAAEGLRDLEPGIYIIRTQKSSVKVIKN